MTLLSFGGMLGEEEDGAIKTCAPPHLFLLPVLQTKCLLPSQGRRTMHLALKDIFLLVFQQENNSFLILSLKVGLIFFVDFFFKAL